jgi:hypothetical protein
MLSLKLHPAFPLLFGVPGLGLLGEVVLFNQYESSFSPSKFHERARLFGYLENEVVQGQTT